MLKVEFRLGKFSLLYSNPICWPLDMSNLTKKNSIYNFLYSFRNGYGDGKACLLKTICEASLIPFDEKTGIFAEILHAILTYCLFIFFFFEQKYNDCC